jgi:PKD repeat protein
MKHPDVSKMKHGVSALHYAVCFLVLGILFTPALFGQTVDFQGNPVTGCAPLRVVFTDQSTGAASTWAWSFPGGSPSSATGAGPHAVIYYVPGTYSVTLTVDFLSAKGVSRMKQDYITVTECKNASIGDRVWNDANGNGIQDAGESGMNGVLVQLFTSGALHIMDALTDASGTYHFGPIEGGNYFVKFIPPPGFLLTSAHRGSDDSHDSDADPFTLRTPAFHLEAGYNETMVDAGMVRIAQPFESDSFNVCLSIDLDVPGVGRSTVSLSGSAVQEVFIPTDGHAADSDGNGLDQVRTALVELTLSGTDPLLGGVALVLNPSWGSFGEIEEQANNTPGTLDIPPFTAVGTAGSYIDAFFEIRLFSLGQVLHNELPIRLQATINHKPPASFNVYTAVLPTPWPFWASSTSSSTSNPAGMLLGMAACGPTPSIEHDVFNVCLSVNMSLAEMGTHTVSLSGLATQSVYFAGASSGSAADGNGNGLDEVTAVLTDLNLHGFDPVAGNITMRLHPGIISIGLIEEQVNNTPGVLDVPPFTPTGTAVSYFNAAFEIELTDMGMCLRTYQPVVLTGTIHNKPPADPDVFSASIPTPVPLYRVTCGSGAVPLPDPPPVTSARLIQISSCGSQQPESQYDFGDAPGPFPTLLADNGARHLTGPEVKGPILGLSIDGEYDGQPDWNATGDDINGIDDEDGVVFSTPLIAGSNATIQVTASNPGILNAWIDFNADGDWSDAGEQIATDLTVSAGVNNLNVAVPASSSVGTSFARFRIASVGGLSSTGLARDGEVEDYKIMIGKNEPSCDLGDAPDATNSSGSSMTAYPAGGPPGVVANFPTVYAAGSPPFGPKHNHPRDVAWLGPLVTLEQEADSGPDEDGSNNILPSADVADRDGADDCIQVPLVLPSCTTTSFAFTVTSVRDFKLMYVNVWFDWNRDGDWNDAPKCETGALAPEWAVQNQAISIGSAGLHTLTTNPFLPWNPVSKTPLPIWMRITLSERKWNRDEMLEPGAGPRGGYELGETEDYYFVPIQEGDRDFGDAPAPYPTKLSANGARHDIVPGLFLGTAIDPEPDGQPDANATGDDLNGIDDEDGVTFTSDLVPAANAEIHVVASGRGYLNAWVDFNRDGDWADAGEHVQSDVTLSPGDNPLSFAVPATATAGKTFARFRFSREKGLNFDGPAKSGEVEDYLVRIPSSGKNPVKWDQPPLKVRPSEWPDSIRHCFEGYSLTTIENYRVMADDWICRDPKPVTSVTWWGSYADWDTTVAPLNAPWGFRITLYKDVAKEPDTLYSRPGVKVAEWKVARGSAGERVVGSLASAWKPDSVFQYSLYIPPPDWFYQEGDSTLYWLSIAALYSELPSEHVWGWLTRTRYFHDESASRKPGGVWKPMHLLFMIPQTRYFVQSDMTFVLGTTDTHREFDFGDAPDPLFPTLLASGGAEHWIDSRVYLGGGVDAEPDGQPSFDASGDGSDEDGVRWPSTLLAGSYNTVKITASTAGFLNAWMDFDGNQEWNPFEEHVCVNAPLLAGTNYVKFLAPSSVSSDPVMARFRFSTEADLTPLGLAIDGEVEDYAVDFMSTGVDDREAGRPGQNRLMQNYPNPFNPSTKIEFELKAAGPVKLALYDLLGRRVAMLADGRMEAGRHTVAWDGKDASGRSVSGGLYILRIVAGDFRQTKKLLLMK